MIQHDIPNTLGPMTGQANAAFILAQELLAMRADLAQVIRAGDRAVRGARLVEVHGQAVVVLGAEEWRQVLLAMIAAGERMVGQKGAMNGSMN